MTLPPKNYYLIPGNGTKNLLTLLIKICVYPFCKLDSIKIVVGLNHCKYIGRTSNKSLFLSPDIVPMRIDDKLKN